MKDESQIRQRQVVRRMSREELEGAVLEALKVLNAKERTRAIAQTVANAIACIDQTLGSYQLELDGAAYDEVVQGLARNWKDRTEI